MSITCKYLTIVLALLITAWPAATQEAAKAPLRLGVPRLSRGSPIVEMALSPEGKALVTVHAEHDGVIFRWDLPSGERHPFTTGKFLVSFSPRGDTVSLAGRGGSVLLAFPSKQERQLRVSPDVINVPGLCQAFSPDDKQLAIGGPERIQLWDPKTGNLRAELPGKAVRVAFAPNSQLLAAAGADQSLRLWDVATRKERLVLPKQPAKITALAFAPNGKTLVCASDNIRFYDAATGMLIGALPQVATERHGPLEPNLYFEQDFRDSMEGACVLAFAQDGSLLATAPGDDILLWDPIKRAELRRLKGHGRVVRALAFLPGDKTLISSGLDGTIRFWNVATGQEVPAATGHLQEVTAIAFSPDGKTLASGSHDRTVRLWDFRKEKELKAWRDLPEEITGLAWSSAGKWLAAGGSKGSVFLWDAASGKELHRLKRVPPKIHLTDAVAARHLAFTAKDTLLAVAGDDPGMVRFWDVQAGKQRLALQMPEENAYPITNLRLLRDGKRLMTLDASANVRTWDVPAKKLLHEINIDDILAKRGQVGNWRLFNSKGVLSPNGERIALSMIGHFQGMLVLKDLSTIDAGKIGKNAPHDGFSAAFSYSGHSLATGSVEGPVYLRNGETGKVVQRLPGHRAWVRSVAFSADGRWLASGSADTTVLIWDTQAIPGSRR